MLSKWGFSLSSIAYRQVTTAKRAGISVRRRSKFATSVSANGTDSAANLADTKQILARNLAFWIEKRGKTQTWLAKELGLTRQAVGGWLHALSPVDIATLGRAAEKLEVPAAWLLYDENEERSRGKPPTKRELMREDEDTIRRIADKFGYDVVRLRPKKPPPH